MLQERLRELGASFEAEGEATRIHIGGVVVEVKRDPELGDILQVQLFLPVPGDDVGEYVRDFRIASRIITGLGGVVSYVAEEAAPGYPVLRAIVPYSGAWMLVKDAFNSVRQALLQLESNHINLEDGFSQ